MNPAPSISFSPSSANQINCLVVDDQSFLLKQTKSKVENVLKECNFSSIITTASNFNDGSEALAKNQFQVIVLDWNLGEDSSSNKTGVELALKVSKMKLPINPIVILHTAEPDEANKYMNTEGYSADKLFTKIAKKDAGFATLGTTLTECLTKQSEPNPDGKTPK